jgi:hypothetical protein
MFDETNQEPESKKNRRSSSAQSPRTRAPRAASASRHARKATGFQGSHRRRNKHWSW